MASPRMRYAPIVLRAAEDAPEGVVEGYASVFDTEYRIGYGLKEAIAPGAFTDTLAARDGVVPMFYQHDWDNPIGYLECSQDKVGLRVVGHLFIDANERARSVYLSMKAGALREWSIGFIPEEITVSSNDDGTELETVTRADLLEASVVVKGANPDTFTMAVRNDNASDGADLRALVLDAFSTLLRGSSEESLRAMAESVDNDALAERITSRLSEIEAANAAAAEADAEARGGCDEDEDDEVDPPVEARDITDVESDMTHLLEHIDKPWARALIAAKQKASSTSD